MLRLIMRRGPTPGAIYELRGDEITIGRGSKNVVVIHDNEVSREHCRLVRFMDDYELQDLGSSNGTFVNGQRVVTNWLLQSGMLIELGDTITLEYERIDISAFDEEAESFADLLDAPEDSYAYKLMMTLGTGSGRVYPLNDVIINVGRDSANDIIIRDPEVSRYHMRLRRSKGGYTLEDLGSTNGTFVNNLPVNDPYLLEPDDVIKLGMMVQMQYIRLPAAQNGDASAPRPLVISDVNAGETSVLHNSLTQPFRDDTLAELLGRRDAKLKVTSLGPGIEPGTLHSHVFIAYARSEWESVVAPLTLTLQDAGIPVWVDQYLAQGSDDWRAAVEQALLECWMMVLVVSTESLASNYVRVQYHHFLQRGKPVIPFLFRHTKPLMGGLSRLRSLAYDADNAQKSFHRLIFEVMQLRRQGQG